MTVSEPRRVIAVGGGAAGFFGAIACAESSATTGGGAAVRHEIVLYEATAHPLAKVRVSGGGRCNVTHACFEPRELVKAYPRGGRELLGAFHRWQPRDTVAWFAAHDVETKTEADGRMFPATDDSATIVDCLLRAAHTAGVRLVTGVGVRQVTASSPEGGGGAGRRDGPRFTVTLTNGDRAGCDRLLLATGGNRSSAGFSIAQALGHTIEPLVPSLFTFHIDDPRLAELAGISVDNVVAVVRGTRLRQSGPLLVTHWGLSGPVILKLSAWGARELAAVDYRFRLGVNFVPNHTRESVVPALTALRRQHPRRHVGTWCPFSVPLRLWERLILAAGISPATPWTSVGNAALGALADQLTAAEFRVTGKSLFKEEFVTCGGVRLSEVDFRTMESRRCVGLHFAGEMLDLDGVTGGFNFQAAWTTGWLAGTAMAETLAARPATA
jgi:predicted Rossmann fold flavoprotein